MNIPSRLLEEAIEQLASLPGIGKRTAMRLALYLLKQKHEEVGAFSHALLNMRQHIKYCEKCHNIADKEVCEICANTQRDHSTICVVEDLRDVMAIENTQQYRGSYHVLGGIISPMDGIGPADLNIDSLIKRIQQDQIKEVVLALCTTMEGDTTNFYLYKRLNEFDITITSIARGVAIGDELEYTDEVTLGRSIVNRTPYERMLVQS